MTLVKFNSEPNNNKRNHNALVPSFSNVFDSIFTDNFFSARETTLVPAVNICENADHFEIDLAAPGLSKSDFKINLDRRMLNVSVQKEQTNEDDNRNFSRKEFSYHVFSRSFTLPESADEHHIAATYNDGILRISIPKREEARNLTRQIQVD